LFFAKILFAKRRSQVLGKISLLQGWVKKGDGTEVMQGYHRTEGVFSTDRGSICAKACSFRRIHINGTRVFLFRRLCAKPRGVCTVLGPWPGLVRAALRVFVSGIPCLSLRHSPCSFDNMIDCSPDLFAWQWGRFPDDVGAKGGLSLDIQRHRRPLKELYVDEFCLFFV
jgi:hypothetical protein